VWEQVEEGRSGGGTLTVFDLGAPVRRQLRWRRLQGEVLDPLGLGQGSDISCRLSANGAR
jgi:hypothetical protein